MKISTRQLYKLINALTSKVLITETEITLTAKTRKSRVIILTADGIVALGYSSPEGKGGAVHQYFQKVVKGFARKQGYSVEIEKHLGARQSVDLSLEDGNEKIAIEISVTTDTANELNNIEKCLKANYDRIFVLCSKERTVENLKKLLEKHFQLTEKEKIKISLLRDLFRLTFQAICC